MSQSGGRYRSNYKAQNVGISFFIDCIKAFQKITLVYDYTYTWNVKAFVKYVAE